MSQIKDFRPFHWTILFCVGDKREGCYKGNEGFYIAPEPSYASFGLKVYTSDMREGILFILPPRPTRIFNLAFLLQHLLRIIRVEDVWHLADPSRLLARYIEILALHTATHTCVISIKSHGKTVLSLLRSKSDNNRRVFNQFCYQSNTCSYFHAIIS